MERKVGKKISLIADLQGVKLRIGTIKKTYQKIKLNQTLIFDLDKKPGDHKRVNFLIQKF